MSKNITFMSMDKRSKSVKKLTKSTVGKRTRKVFGANEQKKLLALFFVLGTGWTFCREHRGLKH